MNYPIKIVAAVVDVHNLTMYQEDGETITIPQGDPRVRALVEKLVPAMDQSVPVYWLTEEDMMGQNHYATAEKKTGGLVRFFKMAKNKLKEIAELFHAPVENMEIGKKPTTAQHTVQSAEMPEPVVEQVAQPVEAPKPIPEEQRPLTKSAAAVAEIMANAKDSSAAQFQAVTKDEVIVAVTEDNTIIPNVEQLAVQMQAVSEGVTSPEGLQRFMTRAASVKRQHSVEDLLRFVEKGELPFADDGSVLVYKRLKSTGDPDVFVDCHSSKVKQRIGSFVHMAESLVDPNRSRECSNGLHVARRDYLSSFSGDVTVLAKLAPEDVIAVPHGDARKLRCRGYHIIARLSDQDARNVCSDRPLEDTDLLANAVAGNHIGITEYVEITEQMGGGLKVTKVESAEERAKAEIRAVQSLDHLPGVTEESSKVDARALALDLAQKGADKTVIVGVDAATEEVVAVEVVEPVKPADTAQLRGLADSINEEAKQQNEPVIKQAIADATTAAPKVRPIDILVANFVKSQSLADAKLLLMEKRRLKKSWEALGIASPVYTKAIAMASAEKMTEQSKAAESLPKDKPVNDDKRFPVAKASPTLRKQAEFKPQPYNLPKEKPVKAVAKPVASKGTKQEQMAKLVEIYNRNPDKANAREIYNLKKESKKSWEVLGVTDKAFIKKIEDRAKL